MDKYLHLIALSREKDSVADLGRRSSSRFHWAVWEPAARSLRGGVPLFRRGRTARVIGSGHVFCSMTSNVTMNLNTLLKARKACRPFDARRDGVVPGVGAVAFLKGMVGHESWMAGAPQAVYRVWTSRYGFSPPPIIARIDCAALGILGPGVLCHRSTALDRLNALIRQGMTHGSHDRERRVVLGVSFLAPQASVSRPASGLRRPKSP